MRLLPVLLVLVFASSRSKAQTYPERIYPDSSFAPFLHGVASGDPLTDRVIIWTKISEPQQKSNALKWEVSPDSNFITLVNSGTIQADASHDFCVKTDVTGLKPGMHYYYRFKNSEGKSSPVGIASTLPATDVQQFKLAVVSCSSIWAGFFNAYKIIAHRPDIDFVVHLGDYVYDYPDDRCTPNVFTEHFHSVN
ncbi:MAG: PhoD-like phosphatase N-terminal domain-containing protein [Bacteroidetes bacterium]|nr:PhoD-like phosphatase N-terminal domain-containing protein [Bacteroidota bacterium]